MPKYQEPIPDNPDGSGDDTVEVKDREGRVHVVPYHYEHLTADTLWEVVGIIPYAGDTPAHLNTYRVRGDILADLLAGMWPRADDIFEEVVSVRRIQAATLEGEVVPDPEGEADPTGGDV